jgi:hypothetical protein
MSKTLPSQIHIIIMQTIQEEYWPLVATKSVITQGSGQRSYDAAMPRREVNPTSNKKWH